MPHPDRLATAALAALIILQAVMLLSLYSGTRPHPPEVVAPFAIAPFAIAPFLGAALAIAAAALILGPRASTAGRGLSALAAIAALVSFGPQKYFDAQFALIWPAVIGGQAAIGGLIAALSVGRAARVGDAAAPAAS